MFTAYLNLNRSLQAQKLERFNVGDDQAFIAKSPYALAISESAVGEVVERKLTPDDNIIGRDNDRTEFVRSKQSSRHLADYIQAIFSTIRRELPRSRTTPRHRQTNPLTPTVTLQHVEICWDFYDEQPLVSVLCIKNKIQSLAQKIRIRYLPHFRFEEEMKYDSPSVIVHLRDGVSVRFYAKTETTIRFEVSYTRQAIKFFPSSAGFLSLSGMTTSISTMQSDAADTINTFQEFLELGAAPDVENATLEELIEVVHAVCPSKVQARNLLTKLALRQSIAPYPKSPDYSFLNALKSKGVLKSEPRSVRRRVFVVTPRYQAARGMLIHYVVDKPKYSVKSKPKPPRRNIDA